MGKTWKPCRYTSKHSHKVEPFLKKKVVAKEDQHTIARVSSHPYKCRSTKMGDMNVMIKLKKAEQDIPHMLRMIIQKTAARTSRQFRLGQMR